MITNWLLTSSPAQAPVDSAASWKQWYAEVKDSDNRFSLAVKGGFLSANVACAFYSGYQMAVRQLLDRDMDGGLAFCVSEEKGNHPKNISTSLRDGKTLSGEKKYIAGSNEADWLVVIAREGGGRDLRAVLVGTAQEQVSISKLESLPILPEVPHGAAVFNNAVVEEVLPGDGHGLYSKSFRSIEDIYVAASMAGFLLRIARQYEWPREIMERLLLLLASAEHLSTCDPLDTALHVLLGAFNREMASVLQQLDDCWETVDAGLRHNWRRDKAIMTIATKAKEARLEKAWSDMQAKVAG